MITIALLCLLLGSIVGLFAGMLGIGGGLIIVPALLYLFSQHLAMDIALAMPMAIATSLSTIILTGMSSAHTHYKLGNLAPRIAGWCALGIAFGAVLGAQVVSELPGETVKQIFAYLVIVIAAQMVFGGQKESASRISSPILVLIGFVTGGISAFMGIGGGALMVPALIWFRVPIKQAIGCAAFAGLIVAMFGTASFIQAGWTLSDLPEGAFGYVYLPATLGIVITSVFTARVGAKISHRLNTKVLKRIFALFLVIVSTRMLLG